LSTLSDWRHCSGFKQKKRGFGGLSGLRSFGGLAKDLEWMAEWLAEHGIEQVAMEAAGVCWITLHEVLEQRGPEVWLVNPSGLTAVPAIFSEAGADFSMLPVRAGSAGGRGWRRPPASPAASGLAAAKGAAPS